MMVTKKVKVVNHKFRGDFEKALLEVIEHMENSPEITSVEIQFSTSKAGDMDVWFSALVIGKGIPA